MLTSFKVVFNIITLDHFFLDTVEFYISQLIMLTSFKIMFSFIYTLQPTILTSFETELSFISC